MQSIGMPWTVENGEMNECRELETSIACVIRDQEHRRFGFHSSNLVKHVLMAQESLVPVPRKTNFLIMFTSSSSSSSAV